MLVAAFIISWLAVVAVLVAWYFDQRAHEAQVRNILDRISTSPRIEVQPSGHIHPPIAPEPAYVSDLPYHDEAWDEFTKANEAAPVLEDDEDE